MDAVALEDVDIIQKYAYFLERKGKEGYGSSPIPEEHLQEIAGRASQGSTEEHFEYLQKIWMGRKFAWVMSGDGLTLFLRYSNLQALRALGCDDRWIRKRLEMGRHFRLAVFYQSNQCVPATWDSIFSLIDKYYSKSISMKVSRHADELKQMSFDEIEARARLSYLQGASYFEVNELPVDGHINDPRLMIEERFSECEGTLEECRGFLYTALCLTNLFDGSGFTKDSNGQLHVREYLQLNKPVRDLPGFRYLYLPIDSSDFTPDA